MVKLDIEKVKADLNASWIMEYTVTLQEDGSVYFGASFDENEEDGPDDEVDYIKSELASIGYELSIDYVEHDNVSGELEPLVGYTNVIPTLEQRVAVYESLLHSLHFASSAEMNAGKMQTLLGAVSAWSYAHIQGNGELRQTKQNRLVNDAFKRIATLVHVELGEQA